MLISFYELTALSAHAKLGGWRAVLIPCLRRLLNELQVGGLPADKKVETAVLMAAFVTGVDADKCLKAENDGMDILPTLWGLIGYQEVQQDKPLEAIWRRRLVMLSSYDSALAQKINSLSVDILVNPAWREWSLTPGQLQDQYELASNLSDVSDDLKDKNTLTKVEVFLFGAKVIGKKAIAPLAAFFAVWGKAESHFAAKFKTEMDRRQHDGLFPDPRLSLVR